jgi:hypothetical protein
MIAQRKAIPTCYRGTSFRSRLEADAAFLFDRLGLGWEYEVHSFLLDSGHHYRPDFLIRHRALWVETRGYSTPEGDAQVEGFSRWIHLGRPEPEIAAGPYPDYLVIAPETITLNEFEGKWGVARAPAVLMRCGNCGSFCFLARGGDEACKARCTAEATSGPDQKWSLGFGSGSPAIDGLPFREWIRARQIEGLLPLI